MSPAGLRSEQAVEVWGGHPGHVAEHHPLLYSVRLQGTAELLPTATRESLEGKEAPENCALLVELRLTTWPRSAMRSGELNWYMEIGHFASWVTGFSGSTGWVLENEHWEHLNHKRYLTFSWGGSY